MTDNININAFLRVLDVKESSTGGGTASSIAGAMAAGLVGMVARLSMGKAGLGPSDHYEAVALEAMNLSVLLFDGGQADAAAFDRVSSAYKMPKESAEEKAIRSAEIQKAILYAAEVPLANAARCGQVIELCSRLKENYNSNAASDLECACYLALAGFKGCAANVRINLPSIKNVDTREEIEGQLEQLEKEAIR